MNYKESKFQNSIMMYHDVIDCLISALEAKDVYTSGHSGRVANMTYELSKKIGISGSELEEIHIAAHVHDIGKIGIPDAILNKPGKLTVDEWLCIKRHSEIGYNILSCSDQLKNISKIVLHHHERWDGSGYPNGLKTEEIPLGSRIITICDSIDAMTSKRAYTSPLSWEQCKIELETNKGTQFQPSLVDALMTDWNYWKAFKE